MSSTNCSTGLDVERLKGIRLVRSLIWTALPSMNEWCCRVVAARLRFRSHKLQHFVLDDGQLLLLC